MLRQPVSTTEKLPVHRAPAGCSTDMAKVGEKSMVVASLASEEEKVTPVVVLMVSSEGSRGMLHCRGMAKMIPASS